GDGARVGGGLVPEGGGLGVEVGKRAGARRLGGTRREQRSIARGGVGPEPLRTGSAEVERASPGQGCESLRGDRGPSAAPDPSRMTRRTRSIRESPLRRGDRRHQQRSRSN